MHKEIGIDLGSAEMLVSTAEEGVIARAPSVMAITREGNRLHSIGHQAEEELSDPARNLLRLRPLRDGLLSNPEATKNMISYALHLSGGAHIIRPRILLGIPFNISEEEENFLEWTAAHAGARETFLVYTPIAALAGLGIPMSYATMIVDVGASQTSLMLTGGNKILYKNTVAVGGEAFNAAIVRYLDAVHGMKISSRTAEAVKRKIGTVWLNREERELNVKGKSRESGEAVTAHLSSRVMFDALEEPTATLVSAVCEAISAIPSEYVGEIFRRGILLCGGGSCLDGLDKMISGVTGVNARVVDKPDEVVAIGLGKILADLPTAMKNEKLNVSMRCMRGDL